MKTKKYKARITQADGDHFQEIEGQPYKPKHPELQRYELFTWKDMRQGVWRLYEVRTGWSLFSSPRKKELEKELVNRVEKELGGGWEQAHKVIQETESVEDFEKSQSEEAQRKEVKRQKWLKLNAIVGYTVPLDGLVSALTGEVSIDVVRWDERLRVPDGVSLSQEIEKRYGSEAQKLAKELI